MATRDLVFELLTEELPPRSLESLSIALADAFASGLDAAAIGHGPIRRYATPRRLAVLPRPLPRVTVRRRTAQQQRGRRAHPV